MTIRASDDYFVNGFEGVADETNPAAFLRIPYGHFPGDPEGTARDLSSLSAG